jgi:hypothetical protein
MNENLTKAHKSKTVWLGMAITILGYFQANLPLAKTILVPVIGPEKIEVLMSALTMALGLSVIVVRFYTDGPLSQK